MLGLEHRNMETGAGFPAYVAMGGGRVAASLSKSPSDCLNRKGVAVGFWAAVLMSGLSGPAWACEAFVDKHNNRIVVKADGSFENGNFNGEFRFDHFGGVAFNHLGALNNKDADTVSGGPVQDRGNGKVAQRIAFSDYDCDGTEALLFVDCNAMASILLEGGYPPQDQGEANIAGYSWLRIKWIQPPYGPIRITSETTVKKLESLADRNNIAYSLSAADMFGEVRERDRYDIYLGCKLFYPDSKGAQS